MEKRIIKLLVVVCLFCSVALAVTACKGVKMTISFIVDGNEYAAINTSGNEIVTIPQSPTKDGYIFDGWYWDDGAWQRPFTANSLLNEPLTSDMSVYAKFSEIHKHSYSAEWSNDERGHWHVATCEHTNETTEIEKHVYDSNYICKICHYQDTSLHGTEIATEVFEINGENLYAKVPNVQETFSFINAIQIADGATFVVATDLAASNVIRTKTVSLEIGDNTYYILVENGSDIQLYTVTLRRRPICTVTFATNGGTACTTQQVEEDSLATKPTTSKTGYTFANWDYDFATPVTQNTTIAASWKANKYNVTYDVNGGILADTQFTVTYDSAYTLAVPTREGHTFQGWYLDETQIADVNGQSIVNWTYTGDKTVTAKWTINSYNVSLDMKCFDSNGKVSGISGTLYGVGMYQFGSQAKINVSIFDSGYNFVGWYDEYSNLISKSRYYTFTVYSDVSYTAKFSYYTLTTNGYVYNNTKISVGTEITLSASKKTLGCDIWLGWYDGDELLTTNSIYTFIMPDRDLTYYAKWKECEEMSNFNFISTPTTCTITGIKDKTITEITVPDYVTHIECSAFSGCSKLEKITLPFVGCSNSPTSGAPSRSFGYIFGESDFEGATAVYYQWEGQGHSYWEKYYIPTSLKNVVITGGKILKRAFSGELTSITIGCNVTSIDSYAFYDCNNLTVYCEAQSKPIDWGIDWSYGVKEVIWGISND